MAVTRLKRKDRQNKVVAKLKQQHKYLHIKTVSVKSPYKDQTVIVED
jgi:hypothetical protein